MLPEGVQPSFWACAPLLAQRLAVHTIYSVQSKYLSLADLFPFLNGPVKSETQPGSSPSDRGSITVRISSVDK